VKNPDYILIYKQYNNSYWIEENPVWEIITVFFDSKDLDYWKGEIFKMKNLPKKYQNIFLFDIKDSIE